MEREATTIENVEENAEEQIEMERNKGKKQKENESGRKRKRDNAVHTTEIRRKSTEEKLARRVGKLLVVFPSFISLVLLM